MGTKVQCESYFPGYFSMRDLNEDSNSCSWPLFYGDKTFTNGQCCNGFLPRVIADAYPANDKDVVKRTMLEHEAIFRSQLRELHRLYQIQRDLMDEIKRKELLKNQIPIEMSFSSSPLASQVTSENARNWHISSFPSTYSACARPSVLGVQEIHSPLSSTKESSAQASPLPSQNGAASKDVEILESRPSKVRRRMFDLQLPADEYIDTEEGEKIRDENVSGISSYLPSRNHKIPPQNETILFLGNGGKNNCHVDASRSESCLRSPINVGDLNKPVEVEEANAAYVDLLGRASSQAGSQVHELASKPKQELLGFPKEISANFHYRSDNETLNIPHLQNNANGKCWFPRGLDSGHSKNNLKSVSPDLQPEKCTSSQPIQVLFSKTREPPTLFLADQGKIDQLRERTSCSLEVSERNHEIANSNYSESAIASHRPSSYPFGPPSDVGKSWCQSVSSWEMPAVSLSQKSMPVQMHPYLNSSATLSRSPQPSTKSHVFFGDQQNYKNNSTSNPIFASEMLNQNGFYHGSSSGSKEPSVRLPSGNFDYWNCASTNNGASEHFINHSPAKFYKSPNCMDLKSARDVDLNASDSSSNKVAHQQGIEVTVLERKHEDHLVALPWLKSKPACKVEGAVGMDLNVVESTFLQSSLNQLSEKSESGKGPNHIAAQNMKLTKCSNVIEACRIQDSDSSCRKILGFPIFEKPCIPKNEFSSFTPSSLALPQLSEEAEDSKKIMVLDINVPCDPAVSDLAQQTAEEVAVVAKAADTKVASFRFHIDLNSCISDDETSMMPFVPGFSAKVVAGIDLEAPAVPESEENTISREEKAHEPPLQSTEHKAESPMDELIRIAADAIVSISSSGYQNHLDDATCNLPEASMTDPLHWFVEIVSSCGEDLESKFDAVLSAKDGEDNMETSWEFIDYFESMTLGLIETKEEDYMPKPLVPENLKLEDIGTTTVPTRSRRGQGRRGRQRRDFQRDILPGLGSLSRHEVTEDLQTFGGMMRATGHPWHSGLTRRNSTRNGCARGRRRSLVSPLPVVVASPPCTPLVQQLHNIEVGLEDRNLTGWGKTTRRPRRQRCPAGNPPSHPLT